MKRDTINKFLNNRCTDAEMDEIIRWADTKAFNEESAAWGFDDWNLYQEKNDSGDDKKFDLLFDKIQLKINDNTQKETTGKRAQSLSLFTAWMTKAAAILLIPVLSFLFYTLSEKKKESIQYANLAVDSLEVIAPVGSRTVVHLPDGSEVHLNYGSKIKYPQFFSGHTREVILTGEGYFDVGHNPEKPFIVKTGKLNIKALGTTFNVLAYPDNDVIETTLVKGKVILEQDGQTGKIETIESLVPGMHVNYNIKTGTVSSSMGSVEKYTGWKDGKLVFEDATITEVTDQLSRMFNVDIEVSDNVKDCIYTVTFVDEPLFQILDLMTMVTPVRYHVLSRQKLSDGTFSKQKIIMEEKR